MTLKNSSLTPLLLGRKKEEGNKSKVQKQGTVRKGAGDTSV